MTNGELPTYYQIFLSKTRYARWIEEKQRRETWEESVTRYIDFFKSKITGKDQPDWEELKQAILNLEVMPSMRSLMTAGKALDRDNVAGFNCSYLAVDHPRAFDEAMYILMCGTGVGFSVERQFISKLPEIPENLHVSETIISVRDSKIGWASSFKELVSLLYSGNIPKWDLSKLRAAGEPLKTFGGRSSGPDPLDDLFHFTVKLFTGAKGRKLTSLECHDLMCKIADIVVVGGVRRSALISLSNLTDQRMATAKTGQWWEENPQRALANNSVCYTEKPDIGIFMKEWVNLYDSKSGERGIFSRDAAKKHVKKIGRRDEEHEFGTNPCSEIILRSNQFCNLSEVVIRPEDTYSDLERKVRIASILGTLQASLTDFRYLRPIWKRNTEEEALLGVSLTGIMDHPILSNQQINNACDTYTFCGDEDKHLGEILEGLKDVAIETNKEWAEKIGINPSTAITCVKPSGTVSQLVDSSSGIHPRYSPYYLRAVRNDIKDPVTQFMIDRGIPHEREERVGSSSEVFYFPMKAPDHAVMRDDRTAIQQLEVWKTYAEYWCEHKPSVTIYVKEHEWLTVGAWVYDNFDLLSGISFLPHTNHAYKQAPYTEITEDEYKEWIEKMPIYVDWENLSEYESEDMTIGTKELACSAGQCEI